MGDLLIDKSHISYKSTDKLYDICQPLFDSFNISFFRYVRAYKDRSRFILATDPDWIDQYFKIKHYLYEFVNFEVWPKDNFSGHAMWTGCNENHKMCQIWNYFKTHKDLGHNLLIYQKRDDMVELFDFNTKDQNEHITSNFLANIDVFKHFTYYFKEKAKDIIKEADATRFKVPVSSEHFDKPDWFFGLQPQQKKIALEQMHIKRYNLMGQYDGIYMTSKELECLKELVKGKTQEEIGQYLNISRRTVEYRLNNLKSKLNCKNQNELISRSREEEVAEIIRMHEEEGLLIEPFHLRAD